jgi:hypothetical protein
MLIPYKWLGVLQAESFSEMLQGHDIRSTELNDIPSYSSEFFNGPAEPLGFIQIHDCFYSQWKIPLYKKEIRSIPPEQDLQSIDLFSNNLRN